MTRTLHRSRVLAGLLSAGLALVARGDDAPSAAAVPAATGAKANAPAKGARNPPGGWRVVMRGQAVYWCMKQKPTGSRVRSEERCMTPDQYDVLEKSSQDMVDDLRRASPPPKGG